MEAILTGDGRQVNNRLRLRKRFDAHTQTIVRLYTNDCPPIRKLNSLFWYLPFRLFYTKNVYETGLQADGAAQWLNRRDEDQQEHRASMRGNGTVTIEEGANVIRQ